MSNLFLTVLNIHKNVQKNQIIYRISKFLSVTVFGSEKSSPFRSKNGVSEVIPSFPFDPTSDRVTSSSEFSSESS